jgi:hypothetical protein
MPFIDTCDSDVTPEFYNLIHAVGKDCPNKHDDVKAVQLMLQMFYQGAGLTAPKGQMVPDGICGPITKNWILKFQLDMRAGAVMVAADQRIDRVRNHQSVGAITHTKYGLLALNEGAATVNPGSWSNLSTMVPMADPATVPPPSSDFVPEYTSQQTSPGGKINGRTPTSPSTQATSPK